ncbi:MAG: transcription antitermination factor NusB [Bdellovibrionaceae bacterium]|nr:transcription antitermination factor NusB [Pseudobdellovibrionaceae bacterium]
MPSTSLRRQSRELALQFLHQIDFTKMALPQSFQDFKTAFSFPENTWPYATNIILGVDANKQEILKLIESTSKNWKLDRIAKVDLYILSIAIFELKFSKENTDKAVIINEALEVAKKYSSAKSSSFINGILDEVA